jgi:hypothetical protein
VIGDVDCKEAAIFEIGMIGPVFEVHVGRNHLYEVVLVISRYKA